MAKNELSTTRKLTRRQFLELSGGAAAFAALVACTPSSPSTGSAAPSGGSNTPSAKVGGQAIISLGEPDTLGPTSRALVGVAARSVADLGEVTLPQFRALVVISSRPVTHVSHLASALDVHSTTATR